MPDTFIAPAFVFAIASMLLAQFLKPFWTVVVKQRWDWRQIFETGGMPSSHTSLVTTLTAMIAAEEGTDSSVFAVVLVFSTYFVFEATGLRQEVGQQAKILNEMIESLFIDHHMNVDSQRLRELAGHTWSEVLGGIVVGLGVFAFVRHLWG